VPSDVVKENASIFKRGSYTIFGSKVIIDKARMTTRPITILPMTESLIPQVGRERKLPRVRVIPVDSFEAVHRLEDEIGQSATTVHSDDKVSANGHVQKRDASKARCQLGGKIDTKANRISVLDFASDTNPGGGYKSNQQGTQEESLCRRSSLALLLESAQYPIPFMGAVLCPEVAVFRDRDLRLRPEITWVSCVAACLRSQSSAGDGSLNQSERNIVKEKIKLVLDGMHLHGTKQVILGAWGCGAFGNDPAEIAACFVDVLKSKRGLSYGFDDIVFAIPNKKMAVIFEHAFSGFDSR